MSLGIAAVVLGLARAVWAAPDASDAAASITVETDTGGCPSRADVVAALNGRLPGPVDGRRGGPVGWRLVLDQEPGEPGIRLRVYDAAGAVTLERRLQSERRGRREAVACAALAEAVAQVVARHLREIDYRPPAAEIAPAEPPPPAAPPAAAAALPPAAAPIVRPLPLPTPAPSPSPGGGWLVVPGIASSGRLGVAGGDRWPRAELALSLQARRRWLSFLVAAGASQQTDTSILGTQPGAALVLRAYPVRAAVGGAWALSSGVLLLPSVGASVDWVTFAARGVDQAASGRRTDVAVEAAMGALRVIGRAAVAVRLGAGWALLPRDFDAGRSQPIFRTPDAYLRLELAAGLALGRSDHRR